MAKDTDVLVVGAGPIGLINAWGIKQLNPDLKIVILEKYAEYKRRHTLVMQADELEAIMKATKTEDHPELIDLLNRLRNDPHIRTNELQQIFTKLALDSGVEIFIENEVREGTINDLIDTDYPDVKLIIGADGTHSVVSNVLFGEDNQVKHEYDFVLQLRFEINGEEQAPGLKVSKFYEEMARHGLIANEYVGHFKDGKTPVTMQMMISKEDFLLLQEATSKNPIQPYNKDNVDQPQIDIPEQLKSFITTYLQKKIADTTKLGLLIDEKGISISVNEAPATHARQIINPRGEYCHIVLVGDAALGLSYFKGLNAGLHASAKFLKKIASSVKDGFLDTGEFDNCLNEYQSWFLNDFAPKKVKEVGQYSFWQIRSFMNVMKVSRFFKNASAFDPLDDYSNSISDYFNHFTQDPLMSNKEQSWRPFPHREYDLVKFGQWSFVPLQHTSKKIAKIFIDYFKPYKGSYQIVQDFKQPLVGLRYLGVGFSKMVVGLFTLNKELLLDGSYSLLRSAIELITTPLTWTVKLITRSIATLINSGFQKIEDNKGINHLAQMGLAYFDEQEDFESDNSQEDYEILEICNDIHRKFNKQSSRGQDTQYAMDEHGYYANIRSDVKVDREKVKTYLTLFSPPRVKSENEIDSDPGMRNSAQKLH